MIGGLYALIRGMLAWIHFCAFIFASTGVVPTMIMAIHVLGALSTLALIILGCNLIKMSVSPPDNMANTAVSILQIYLPAYLMISGVTMAISSTYLLLQYGGVLSHISEGIARAYLGPARAATGLGLSIFSQQHFRNQHLNNPPDEPLRQFFAELNFRP